MFRCFVRLWFPKSKGNNSDLCDALFGSVADTPHSLHLLLRQVFCFFGRYSSSPYCRWSEATPHNCIESGVIPDSKTIRYTSGVVFGQPRNSCSVVLEQALLRSSLRRLINLLAQAHRSPGRCAQRKREGIQRVTVHATT